MKYFTDYPQFNKQMQIVKEILERKGFVLSSDHPYANSMQYPDAFKDVKEWLDRSGYIGTVENIGAYDGVDEYGLYDSSCISLQDMIEKLKKEARAQL